MRFATIMPSPPRDATPTARGYVNGVAQVFAGLKTFNNGIVVGNPAKAAFDAAGQLTFPGFALNSYLTPIILNRGTYIGLEGASQGASGGIALGAEAGVFKLYSNNTAYLAVNPGVSVSSPDTISSSKASGSDAFKLLDGAFLSFSTADSNAKFYRSVANTIRTPGAFTADGIVTVLGLVAGANGINPTLDNTLDIGQTALRFKDSYIMNMRAGANLAFSATAPTIASGFGTSPSIVAGTAVGFKLNVGTGGTATTGVITLPAATTGWIVHVQNLSSNTATVFLTKQTATTTTSATIGNYSTAGVAAAWAASDILAITCTAF